MNKNILIIGVVLLVIIGAGFAFLTFRGGQSGNPNSGLISSPKNDTANQEYTLEEVSSHNSESDC